MADSPLYNVADAIESVVCAASDILDIAQFGFVRPTVPGRVYPSVADCEKELQGAWEQFRQALPLAASRIALKPDDTPKRWEIRLCTTVKRMVDRVQVWLPASEPQNEAEKAIEGVFRDFGATDPKRLRKETRQELIQQDREENSRDYARVSKAVVLLRRQAEAEAALPASPGGLNNETRANSSHEQGTWLFVGTPEQLQTLASWLNDLDRAAYSHATEGPGAEVFVVDLGALNKALAFGNDALGCLHIVEMQKCSGLIGELQRAVAAILAGGLEAIIEPSAEQQQADRRLQGKLREAMPYFHWLGACVRDKLTAGTKVGPDKGQPGPDSSGNKQLAGRGTARQDGDTVAMDKAPPHCPGSEPVLSQDNYQRILGILRSMSAYIERNPSTFAALDEEGIRDHFLLQLNGQFKGGATGETFNGSGKTDILVRVGDRNIFIAECKFWHGPAGFGKAIDQLLGYLTWRDCKCALLIFNRNKDTTAVAEKIHETMTTRKEWKQTVAHDVQGDSQYVFVKADDSSGEILITTQLFDVPRTLKRPGNTRKSRPRTAKR